MELSITPLQRNLNQPAAPFIPGIKRFGHNDEEADVHPGSPQDGMDTFLSERPLQEFTPGSLHRAGGAGTSTPDRAGSVHHFTLGAAASLMPSAPLAGGMTDITPPPAHFKMAQGISLDRAAEILASNSQGVTEAWDCTTGNLVKSSPCVGPDGTVYVGSDDHKVYALREGKKIWEFEAENLVYSSPCVGPDGTVYVGSYDHKVYALREGKKLWEFKTGDKVLSSPCVGLDGTVYVGSNDHKVYALRAPDMHMCADIMDENPLPGEDDDGVTIDEGWLVIGDVKLRVNETGDSEER